MSNSEAINTVIQIKWTNSIKEKKLLTDSIQEEINNLNIPTVTKGI